MKVRSTSLKHNKVMYLPQAMDGRSEIKIQSQRVQTVDIAKEYQRITDHKHNTNLTELVEKK